MMLVLTSVSNISEANDLAQKIVREKLAACVQILPPMTSIYFWEGDIKNEPEHLLFIKTDAAHFDRLEKFIIANHTYDVPEIVALKADSVSASYLEWLNRYLT